MMSRLDQIKKENNDSDDSFNDSGIGDASFQSLETENGLEPIRRRLSEVTTEENPSSEAVGFQVAGNDEEAAVAARSQSSSKRSDEEYTEEHVTVEPGNPDSPSMLLETARSARSNRQEESPEYAELRETLSTNPQADIIVETSKFLQTRTVVFTPKLNAAPMKSLNREKPILLASWNPGGFNELTEATLIVLLGIMGVDFLCLQEIFCFNSYRDLMKTYGYSYVMLPHTVDNRRGLFILFKNGLLDYVGNARGKINANCVHLGKHYPEGDFEHISMDINIGGEIHRIVNYYHLPLGKKECFTKRIVADFNSYKHKAMEEKKNDDTYVHFFGDMNSQSLTLKQAKDKNDDFPMSYEMSHAVKELTKKRILSCLPRITKQNVASNNGWFTHQMKGSPTAPDAVFSHWSKEPRELKAITNNPAGIVVHKPVSHIEILKAVKYNKERLSEEPSDSTEPVNKVDTLFTGKETQSKFHYVILAEFAVRKDMTIPVHCSPVLQGPNVAENQNEQGTKFFCSGKSCKVLSKHIFNDVNLNDLKLLQAAEEAYKKDMGSRKKPKKGPKSKKQMEK